MKPSKVWQYKNTVYLTGETIAKRLDAKALGLQPLELKDEGIWEPDKEDELFDRGDPFEKYYLPIMAYGPRREFKLEQIIPYQDPDDGDSDPISEAGLRIAELSLGGNFHDLLPWEYIDNRPFMRCLYGFGQCLWRSGDMAAARQVFERMLWLNPRDNQGAKFLLAKIDAGRSWYENSAEEENERMKK